MDCLAATGPTDLGPLFIGAIGLLVLGAIVLTAVAARRRAPIVAALMLMLVVGGVVVAQAPAPSFAASDQCEEPGAPTPTPMQTAELVSVTPVAPTLVSDECGVNPTVTVAQTPGVTYTTETTVSIEGEPYTVVTASANPGFVLADGATTTWSFGASLCPTPVTPEAPVLVSQLCGEFPVVQLPNVDGLVYTETHSAGDPWITTVTVSVAHAPVTPWAPGIVITPGAVTEWTFEADTCNPGGGGQG